MKKLTLLILMSFTIFSTAYCGDIDSSRLKEAIKYLAEGAECKEILIKKDSLILNKDIQIVNYKQIVIQLKQKDSIKDVILNSVNSDLTRCAKDNQENTAKLAKVKNTRNILIKSNIVTGIALILSIVLLIGL